MIIVARTDPRDPQATALLQQSHALMQSLFAPEENHFLSIDALCADTIHFFTAREGDTILGTGALKVHDSYGEIKSMFVAEAARGKGVGDALMRQIEAGEIKIVLIFKLERVLRSTDEWGPFRSFLQQHGCRLVSPTEDLSDETPSGRLKNNLMMSVAEYERLNTAEKIRIKLNEQAKRGFWTGGQVPFGYVYDETLQGLSPHPTEAATLRRIFDHF